MRLHTGQLKYLYVFITVFTLIVSLFFFGSQTIPKLQQPMISSTDGYSRLSLAVFIASFGLNLSGEDYVWLPFSKILTSIPLILFSQNDQYIAARIFSWLCIITTSLIIYKITHTLTKNTFFSLFAFSLSITNPLFVSLSLQTLSENTWILLVSLSTFFILQKNPKSWSIGFFFWILSQITRFESWYLTPLIICCFWFYHRSRRYSIYFLLSSLIFPIFWLLLTYINTGDLLYYFHQKMLQAEKGPEHIYYHLKNSFNAWFDQLSIIHGNIILIPFFVGLKVYLKQKNILFFIPIFVFISLVFQVYFGTMEYFPSRYLSLIPVFIIPLTIVSLISLLNSKLLTILILAIITLVEMLSSSSRTRAMLESPIPELFDIIQQIEKLSTKPSCYNYIEEQKDSTFSAPAFWYLSNVPINKFRIFCIKDKYSIYTQNENSSCISIIDKGINQSIKSEINLNYFQKILENSVFIVAKNKQL